MIFEELSVFLKANLSCPNCSSSIKELFFVWMKLQLQENSKQSNCSKIIKNEFRSVDLVKKGSFIIPKSERAARLLKFLNEYLEIIQAEHNLKSVSPKKVSKKNLKRKRL